VGFEPGATAQGTSGRILGLPRSPSCPWLAASRLRLCRSSPRRLAGVASSGASRWGRSRTFPTRARQTPCCAPARCARLEPRAGHARRSVDVPGRLDSTSSPPRAGALRACAVCPCASAARSSSLGLVIMLTDSVRDGPHTAVCRSTLINSLGLSPLQFGVSDGSQGGSASLVARLLSGFAADNFGRYRSARPRLRLSSFCDRAPRCGALWALLGANHPHRPDGKGISHRSRDSLSPLSSEPTQLRYRLRRAPGHGPAFGRDGP